MQKRNPKDSKKTVLQSGVDLIATFFCLKSVLTLRTEEPKSFFGVLQYGRKKERTSIKAVLPS